MEAVAKAIYDEDTKGYEDEIVLPWDMLKARWIRMARAAIAAMPSSADDNWLDAALAALTTDDLPGKTLSIYRHDGQWGAQQHMTHLEEQYPTDVCGHGDGVLEAVLDAVAKAKGATP